LAITLLVALLAGGAALARPQIQEALFYVTGEEAPLPQISGGIQYALTQLQPAPDTGDDIPAQHAGVNPYGVNTFLQNEVEPTKREQTVRLISEAGIHWIRQEFPWEDIEIHAKGDFEDRRHEPHQSAWAKYDHIVALAETYDLKIMARLSNPPAWSRALTNTVGTFAPPDDLDDYGDFVAAVAGRYRGRIAAYQIWNEPNIYPEWGEYPISAEAYAALLKEGYTRVKAADPEAIVVMGALAATIELDRVRRYSPDGQPTSPGGLSDVLFLQQLYNAGAAPYFDVLAMQGYGLWSGPYDRRMQPRVLNFSRPLYVREVMVRNGDAHKAIWLSELGWNALPSESNLPPAYGRVTLEQQARYTALAYERMEREWPWLGVGFYWFFKQVDERERDTNPQYYFRMVEPDFTPLPVYHIIKEQANKPPIMYQGHHEAGHWAVTYQGAWRPTAQGLQTAEAGATTTFMFEGSSLSLAVGPEDEGRLRVQIDQTPAQEIDVGQGATIIPLVSALAQGPHTVTLTLVAGRVTIESFIVKDQPSLLFKRVGSAAMVLATLAGVWMLWRQRKNRS
jgi:hypothetical protein